MTAKEYREKLSTKDEKVKLFNFGPYQLFSFRENKYEPPAHTKIDENQQVLLDNLWNAKTSNQKQMTMRALSQYLHSIQKKPISKNFSHYVVVNGFQTGVCQMEFCKECY